MDNVQSCHSNINIPSYMKFKIVKGMITLLRKFVVAVALLLSCSLSNFIHSSSSKTILSLSAWTESLHF
jgi:hypothetical protein